VLAERATGSGRLAVEAAAFNDAIILNWIFFFFVACVFSFFCFLFCCCPGAKPHHPFRSADPNATNQQTNKRNHNKQTHNKQTKMAHTAHHDERMMEELRMTPAEIEERCEAVAAMVRAAANGGTDSNGGSAGGVVFFTGAGISRACGVPDYRSRDGCWSLAAAGKTREAPTTPMHLTYPSLTHRAIVSFQQQGKLQLLISQNVDGLHRRSGIVDAKICELHGNSNIEECASCGKPHHRDLPIHGDDQHFTGRKCVACGGALRDTIINFGENLSPLVLERAFAASRTAAVHIVVGSSCVVAPASKLPVETKQSGGKLVVVNLQRTPLVCGGAARYRAPAGSGRSKLN
jgi:NAD-dependent SIR2 family protein deacetylase